MAITARESKERILDELGTAVDQAALALACLGEAYEQLDVMTADRLEAELFRPAQRAYAGAKRTHSRFAQRAGIEPREFGSATPGPGARGVTALVERATTAAAAADRIVAELQDSGLPVEAGDAELRAGLAEIRATLGDLPAAARRFLRTLGR